MSQLEINRKNWKSLHARLKKHIKMEKILDMLNDDDEIDEEQQQAKKIPCYKYLISPTNKRLNQFQLVVSVFGIIDFIISIHDLCFHGHSEDNLIMFYEVLMALYLVDIATHFFEMYETNSSLETNILQIIKKYLFSFFIVDFVSLIPYVLWLRAFRVIRITTYMTKISENFGDALGQVFRLKKQVCMAIMRFCRFFFTMALIVHVFASIFCGIGENGWRVNSAHLIPDPTNDTDVYIAGVYWIFLTFTTVGYGDISGFTENEYLYTMMVELVGIVFFSYFTGNIYQILDDTQSLESIRNLQDDELDLWIIKLGKAPSVQIKLEQEYHLKIVKYMNNYWRNSLHCIADNEFWTQLPPKLQKQLADSIFSQFYAKFNLFFEDCEKSFQRFIALNCKYKKFEKFSPAETSHYDPEFVMTNYSIINAGDHATHVHFILSGRVIVCNRTGQYRYACLESGSWFGEMYMTFNQTSTYQYEYPINESVETLAISRKKFKQALSLFPASAEVIKNRSLDRRRKLREEKRMLFGAQIANKAGKTLNQAVRSNGDVLSQLSRTILDKDNKDPLSPSSQADAMHIANSARDSQLDIQDAAPDIKSPTNAASKSIRSEQPRSKKKKKIHEVTLPSDFEIKMEKERQKKREVDRQVQQVILDTQQEHDLNFDSRKNAMKDEFQFDSEMDSDESESQITDNELYLLDQIEFYRKELKEVYQKYKENKTQFQAKVEIIRNTVDRLRDFFYSSVYDEQLDSQSRLYND